MTMITSRFFNMGQIIVTHSINDYMSADRKFAMEINLCLRRFAVKDFGCISEEDKQSNDDALQYPNDLYLLASYETSKGRVWIITNRISEKLEIMLRSYVFQMKDRITHWLSEI